jgi:hypothetical protein
MPIERAEIHGADLLTRRAGKRQPRDAGRDRGADRRVEPESPTAGLARIPDADDLLGLGNRLALDLGAFGRFSGTCGGALPFLRSAVRSNGGSLSENLGALLRGRNTRTT